MLLDGAFTALLLLICGASAVIVLPPTNVTVSCQNLKVSVSWEHSEQEPNTRFRVNIRGAAGNSENETTDHQYDLTPFIWSSEEHYMDNFGVTVTAIRGGKESKPVQSETFAFNYLRPTVQRCDLDFPPVTLKEATVTFTNPLHYYSELKRANKPDAATFKFYVSSNHGETSCDCTVKDENCRCLISLPEGVNQCVTLKGMLFDGIGVGHMMFRQTDRICDSDAGELHVITLAILLSITALIIIIITIIICKVKAWTMETPSLPKSLRPVLKERDLKYKMVSKTDISTVGVTVNKKPLVSSEEENNPTKNLQHSSTGSGFQPPSSPNMNGGLSESRNKELESVGLTSEGQKTDEDSGDDSEKTECISIYLEEEEEEEEERSPYDCPHVLQVDMGDGDMATGYTGP